jgi:alginate O-acetyltransferase complex protein AlgI
MMGFRLMLNFNNPYTATGLGDFWNRWHISLSTWFKDYLYFPLGGSRGTKMQVYRNIFLTMVTSGIWHGAGWNYIIWGALHALGRLCTRDLELTEFYKQRVPRLVKQLVVFAFISFTWIFFRAPTLPDAWLIISRIFTTGWIDPQFPLTMAALILAVWIYQLVYTSRSPLRRVLESSVVRVGLATLMIAYLLIVAQPSTKQFIYFQF